MTTPLTTALLFAALFGSAAAASQVPAGRDGTGQGRPAVESQDRNQDGFVSRAEHRAWANRAFAAMDSNQDGRLTRQEFLAGHMGQSGRAPGMGRRRQTMQSQMRERKLARFAAMDRNSDRIVTRREFTAYGDRTFTALDSNRDGKVSISEFRGGYRGW